MSDYQVPSNHSEPVVLTVQIINMQCGESIFDCDFPAISSHDRCHKHLPAAPLRAACDTCCGMQSFMVSIWKVNSWTSAAFKAQSILLLMCFCVCRRAPQTQAKPLQEPALDAWLKQQQLPQQQVHATVPGQLELSSSSPQACSCQHQVRAPGAGTLSAGGPQRLWA